MSADGSVEKWFPSTGEPLRHAEVLGEDDIPKLIEWHRTSIAELETISRELQRLRNRVGLAFTVYGHRISRRAAGYSIVVTFQDEGER